MVEPGARILLPFRPITHLLRPRQDLTEGLHLRPGRNCATTRGITHPFQAVAAPAHPGTAQLIKNVAYQDCEATES